jgi:CheY-like chemotaxis protein
MTTKPEGRQLVVLNVDDNAPALYAKDRLLRLGGYTVANATTGASARDLAERLRPDVILLDIHLPDMDGRELCRQLKGDADLKHIPIVLVSATLRGHAQQLDGMRWGGADAYLEEPFEPEMLVSTLRSVLRV